MNDKNDKMRKLTNKITLIGKLAELEVTEGTTKNDSIPYVSIKGAVQCGDSRATQRKFEVYAQEYKIDKETKEKVEKKSYKNALQFVKDATVSGAGKDAKYSTIATVGEENAFACKLVGNFTINDYVDATGTLKESLRISINQFYKPDADEAYGAMADIEGYIKSIKEETRGEDQTETGRLRVELLTNDFFGNLIPMRGLIVEKEFVDDVRSAYEEGQTATFFTKFKLSKTTEPKKKGGFGTQRSDERAFFEQCVEGAETPYDEDNEKFGISKSAIKIALNERKIKLDEIKAKGYLGNKGSGSASTTTTSKSGFKKTDANISSSPDDIEF